MEICKTRAKKSNPGLLKFFFVLVGHGVITGSDKATTCTCQFKAPKIYLNCTINEGHSENMFLNGKIFWRLQRENNRISTLDPSKEPNWAPGP